MKHDEQLVRAIQAVLRARATSLALDPESITSPTPSAITGRTANGELIRLDIRTYTCAELSL